MNSIIGSRMLKPVVAVLIMVMLIASITPSVSATENTSYSKDDLEQIEQISEELEFYFEEIGELKADGSYQINDLEALNERLDAGDPTAEKVYEIYTQTSQPSSSSSYQTQSASSFANCVVGKFQDSYGAIARGFLTGAIYQYIKNKQWDLAARLMFNTLKAAGFKTNVAGLAVEAGIYGFQCRGKW